MLTFPTLPSQPSGTGQAETAETSSVAVTAQSSLLSQEAPWNGQQLSQWIVSTLTTLSASCLWLAELCPPPQVTVVWGTGSALTLSHRKGCVAPN